MRDSTKVRAGSPEPYALFRAQGFDGVDLGGAAGGEVAGEEGGRRQQYRDGDEGQGIGGANAKKQRFEDAHAGELSHWKCSANFGN